jgi:hypothetical protein
VLLPKLSVGGPKVTVSNFKHMKDCVHWLGNIRRGATWDEELELMLIEDDADGASKAIFGEHEGGNGVEGVPE